MRPSALPRALFVANAIHEASADAALDAIDSSTFDPRREVVLEESVGNDVPLPASSATGRAVIQTDEPERVIVAVDADGPGFLVLGDLF
jgi:hypothetical protein